MNVFQGGIAYQVYNPQGSKPLESLKIAGGAVRKEYDKPSKSQVVVVDQATSKITVPKTNVANALLVHPIVVIQLFALNISSITIEFSVVDALGKRRLIFSNSFASIQAHPQHTKFPFQLLPRNVWMDLLFDVRQLHHNVYEGRASVGFRGVESITISGAGCRVRRIYTLREVPPMGGGGGGAADIDAVYRMHVPSQFTLPPDVEQLHIGIVRGDELMGRPPTADELAVAPSARKEQLGGRRDSGTERQAMGSKVPSHAADSSSPAGRRTNAEVVPRATTRVPGLSAQQQHPLSSPARPASVYIDAAVALPPATSIAPEMPDNQRETSFDTTVTVHVNHQTAGPGPFQQSWKRPQAAALQQQHQDEASVMEFSSHGALTALHQHRQASLSGSTASSATVQHLQQPVAIPTVATLDAREDSDADEEFVVQHAYTAPCSSTNCHQSSTRISSTSTFHPYYGAATSVEVLPEAATQVPMSPPSIENSHRRHRQHNNSHGNSPPLSRPNPMATSAASIISVPNARESFVSGEEKATVVVAASNAPAAHGQQHQDTTVHDEAWEASTARQLRLSESVVMMGGETIGTRDNDTQRNDLAAAIRNAARNALSQIPAAAASKPLSSHQQPQQSLPPVAFASPTGVLSSTLPPDVGGVALTTGSVFFRPISAPSSEHRYVDSDVPSDDDDPPRDPASSAGGPAQPREKVSATIDPRALYVPSHEADAHEERKERDSESRRDVSPPAASTSPLSAAQGNVKQWLSDQQQPVARGGAPHSSNGDVVNRQPLLFPHGGQPPPWLDPALQQLHLQQQQMQQVPAFYQQQRNVSGNEDEYAYARNSPPHNPPGSRGAFLSPPPPVRLSHELGCSPPDPHVIAANADRYEYDPIVGCYFDRVTNRFVRPPTSAVAPVSNHQDALHGPANRGQVPGTPFR